MNTGHRGTVRWGVIGAGGIARRRTIPEGILPASNATLAAVYCPFSGEEIAREFGARCCRTIGELLAGEVDAVYVASPVHLHREQVVQSAAAGKHVLCEKPLGLDVPQAETMLASCRRAGVKLGVGLMMRFHAAHVEAKRLIDQGRLGRPVYGRAQLSCWYPPIPNAWRQDPALGGGGSLVDLGCHCIDLLETFFGRTKRVSCSTASLVHGYPVEDTAVVLLEFESGARGTVDCLFNVPDVCSRNRLELYGSNGSLLAEGTIGQAAAGSLVVNLGVIDAGYDARQQRAESASQMVTPTPINPYRAQIEAFSAAILGNTEPPVGAADGLWIQRVLAACYDSAKSGRAVTI